MNDTSVSPQKQPGESDFQRRSPPSRPSQCQSCVLIDKCASSRWAFVSDVIAGRVVCLDYQQRVKSGPTSMLGIKGEAEAAREFGGSLSAARWHREAVTTRIGNTGKRAARQPFLLAGEDMIEFKTGLPGRPVGGGDRSFISGFSRESRNRMLKRVCCLKPVGDVFFITLTYSDDYVKDFQVWKNDFDNFFHRLQRVFPNVGVLWREGIEARKSGLRVGELAPHFHLLTFGVDVEKVKDWDIDRHWLPNADNGKKTVEFQLQKWVKENWFAVNHVSDPQNEVRGADVRLLDGRKAIFNYVSKYAAKVGGEFEADGRVIDPSSGEVLHTGRIWGVKGNVPDGSVLKIPLSWDEVRLLKVAVKHILKGRGEKSAKYGEKIFDRSGDFWVAGIGTTKSAGTFPLAALLGWLDAGGVPDE